MPTKKTSPKRKVKKTSPKRKVKKTSPKRKVKKTSPRKRVTSPRGKTTVMKRRVGRPKKTSPKRSPGRPRKSTRTKRGSENNMIKMRKVGGLPVNENFFAIKDNNGKFDESKIYHEKYNGETTEIETDLGHLNFDTDNHGYSIVWENNPPSVRQEW